MRTKTLSLALGGLLSLGIAGAALAQEPAPPTPDQAQNGPGHGRRPMDPNRQLERLTRELNLSPDQQSQIKPVLVERDQKMQALFQDQSLPREDRRSRMQAIRQDSQSRIEAVLNDQQKQKFASIQDRMRRRGPGGEAPPPEGAPQPQ